MQNKTNKIYINHPQRHRDYPDKDYDSLATTHAFLLDATAETVLRITRHRACVSSVRRNLWPLPSLLYLQTAPIFCLERSTSKMTSGSVATRASAWGQTPRGGSVSFGARIKERKLFRYPKHSISCIQPPAHLAVSSAIGGYETSWCSCVILSTAKAWPRQDLCTNESQLVAAL
jgi:hypothetical protein